MATFRVFSPFSMRDTAFFFGVSNDIQPTPQDATNVFTTGRPVVSNFFSLETEGISRVDLSGKFFTDATGKRDGKISSLRLGNIVLDEDGEPTNLISITLLASNLSADRSSFDNLIFAGNPLGVFSLFGRGDDVIAGSSGDDVLFGFRGDDTMVGGSGNDLLKGGSGDDVIRGAIGADNVNGGSGDDSLSGNGGFDTLVGGAGEDLLLGGGGRDNLRGGAGDDTMNGNGGADRITAGAGDDVIDGAKGADLIDAGAGDDIVRGGNGRDTLEGGTGDDRLTGGARVDTFVFASNGGDDVVTDYEDNLDKIQIEGNFAFVDIDIDQDGADAIISFGAATITLLNQDATELTETDFLF